MLSDFDEEQKLEEEVKTQCINKCAVGVLEFGNSWSEDHDNPARLSDHPCQTSDGIASWA